MKVEYSKRAVADLRKVAADSRRVFGDPAANALEARIRAVIDRISRDPLSAPEVDSGRVGMQFRSFVIRSKSFTVSSMIAW